MAHRNYNNLALTNWWCSLCRVNINYISFPLSFQNAMLTKLSFSLTYMVLFAFLSKLLPFHLNAGNHHYRNSGVVPKYWITILILEFVSLTFMWKNSLFVNMSARLINGAWSIGIQIQAQFMQSVELLVYDICKFNICNLPSHSTNTLKL